MSLSIEQIQEGVDNAVVLHFVFDDSEGCWFKVIDCNDYADVPCQLKLKGNALEIRSLDDHGDVDEVVWTSETLHNATMLEASYLLARPQFLHSEKYLTEEYTVFASKQDFQDHIVEVLQSYPLQQVSLWGLAHVGMFLRMNISDLADQVLQVLYPTQVS